MAIAVDPRGTKRPIGDVAPGPVEESSQPQFKRAHVEPVSADRQIQALFDAIAQGNVNQVEALLKHAPALRGAYSPHHGWRTPLCEAAAQGQVNMVALLLRLGESADRPARDGATPLLLAVANDQLEVIKMLLLVANPNLDLKSNIPTLMHAIANKKLEACKLLISAGVDLHRVITLEPPFPGKYPRSTTLLMILRDDFSELISWLLQAGILDPDVHEAASKMPLINLAAYIGSVSTVEVLLQRGANPMLPATLFDGKVVNGVLACAEVSGHGQVIECMLRLRRSGALAQSVVEAAWNPISLVGIDLKQHPDLWLSPGKNVPDGLADAAECRQPRKMLERLAQDDFVVAKVDWHQFHGQGWSAFFLPPHSIARSYVLSALILGTNVFKRLLDKQGNHASAAQQLQILVEMLSVRCGLHAPFSNQNLTPETEQVMNRMFDLQRELMLSGIAELRQQFNELVQRLPELCMNVYISRTHRLNEPDLYRQMTEAWGLYDPVARSVLRLVNAAYSKWYQLEPARMSAEARRLSASEQFTQVMVALLEDWDPALEFDLAKAASTTQEQRELTSELLDQQWRLFSEAVGVTKPKASRFGPHRPAVPEPEPAMAVDGTEKIAVELIEEVVEDVQIAYEAEAGTRQ
jgi:hypothetical protein